MQTEPVGGKELWVRAANGCRNLSCLQVGFRLMLGASSATAQLA